MTLRNCVSLIGALVLLLPSAAVAHDIPADVTVQAFLKPEGQLLRLIVRVPLKAMLDIDFPKRGPGYLDLSRVDASLRHAATLWVSDRMEVFEDEISLPAPKVVQARVSLQSDKSFGSYEEALGHVTGAPLPDQTELFWDQAMLDVLFEYPIISDRSPLSIRSGLSRLGIRVVTVLRFVAPGGPVGPEWDRDVCKIPRPACGPWGWVS